MKFISLILWVTQFGFSACFPLCAFLLLASWMRKTWALGPWITVACGILGLLTSISTVRGCIRALRKEAEKAGAESKPPVAFNDHK